ncbi:MAG: outer membrane beta-barrel protein [Candidatus Obscuribacterales bacterium]|nr:outer membrane beta-barrel protein [Candidatus Obscuribacterales bacterium]
MTWRFGALVFPVMTAIEKMKLPALSLIGLAFLPLPVFGQVAKTVPVQSYVGSANVSSASVTGKLGNLNIATEESAQNTVSSQEPSVLLMLHGPKKAEAATANQKTVQNSTVVKAPQAVSIPAALLVSQPALTPVPVLAALQPANAVQVNGDGGQLISETPQPLPTNSAPPSNTSAVNYIPKLTASAQYPFAPEGETRRALPSVLDPVFPSTEYIGVAGQTQIGVPNLNPVFPLEKAIYKACPVLKKARIEIYGWTNPGVNRSTSIHSNVPLSYAIVPNHIELDQQVIRIDRMPDTVQQEHNDWGFRLSMVYGIDTRYTVATGWYPASGQVLGQNRLYSWDPVECYGVYYIPKIKEHKLFDGLVIKAGRYISPSDIEAQLAPDNYLWTHSLMFTVDNYTQTGVLASLKLNKQWMLQAGVHAGDDIAPWAKAAIPSAEACLRWQSKTNKDSWYFTANSFNNGHYRLADKNNGQSGHDNLQQLNVTWGHRFSRRVHMMTEAYYMYEINALAGGTVVSGPPKPYFTGTGPGSYLHGLSQAWGVVNYTNIKITDKDYISIRPVDFLGDPRGLRTGFQTTLSSWTVGWCHRFNDLLCIRPEIRYERSLNSHNGVPVTPYDDGKRMFQFTFGADLIQRF